MKPIPNLPKGPFSYEVMGSGKPHPFTGITYILDADGAKVATLLGSPERKRAIATLLIEARDKLP